MAGHVLRLPQERPAHTVQCTGCPKTAVESGGGRTRHGIAPSKKTSKRWVSADIEPPGSPVTVMDGGFSSPDAPRGPGTGGPKSK